MLSPQSWGQVMGAGKNGTVLRRGREISFPFYPTRQSAHELRIYIRCATHFPFLNLFLFLCLPYLGKGQGRAVFRKGKR